MKEIKTIESTLKDLVGICKKLNIDYRIIGSCAMVGAARNLYRIPNDVDVLFDQKYDGIIFYELINKGYKHSYHSNEFDSIFLQKLQRFTKGNQIIEPRNGKFINDKFITSLLLPIPFIPKSLRPKLTLVFGKQFFAPTKYQIGKIEFNGLKKEALHFCSKYQNFH